MLSEENMGKFIHDLGADRVFRSHEKHLTIKGKKN